MLRMKMNVKHEVKKWNREKEKENDLLGAFRTWNNELLTSNDESLQEKLDIAMSILHC